MTEPLYRRTDSEGGLRIVTEQMPSVRSACVGIWVQTGSVYEQKEKAGISHLLEHMVFRGTKQRNGLEIVQAIEGVGGHINAFTSRELTCYHAQILDKHLNLAVDVLCDILMSAQLTAEDLEREKQVVIEEIRHYEDSPDDLVFEYFARTMYGDHPLARPIMGSTDTVSAFTRDDLYEYVEQNYSRNRIVVSAAGNLDHDILVQAVENRISRNGKPVVDKIDELIMPIPREDRFPRSVQGVHICQGVPGLKYSDKRRFAGLILSIIMGGGMSSRLFQRIREKEALAYSIFTFFDTMKHSGSFGVYLGTDPERFEHTLEVLYEEYQRITEYGILEDELNRAKEQLKGNLMLGLEGTSGRMFRLAKLEIYLKRFVTLDETVDLIDAVTTEGVIELARDFLDIKQQYTAIIIPENSGDRRSQ